MLNLFCSLLEKMNVLEFSNYIPAALLGKHLKNIGFSVTKIERPISSRGRSEEIEYMKHMKHDIDKDKKHVLLDLPTEKNKLEKLIETADIVIENFAPSVASKRGFDFETCKRINPNVIYISLPGFMPDDTPYKNTVAWDGNIMASSGVFCDMGLNRKLLGIKASYSSLTLPSSYGSSFALFVLMCAIRSKRCGEHFVVPLASSLMEALVHNSLSFPLDTCYMNMRKRTILKEQYPISEEELDQLQDPFFRKYVCLDNRPFYLVCPAHIRHQKQALKVLGIETQVLNIMSPVDVYSEKFNYGLGCGNVHEIHAKQIYPLMKEAFNKKTSSEWEYLFGSHGVPAIAHKTKQEWIECSHAKDSGLVVEKSDSIQVGPIGWFHFSHNISTTSKQQKPKQNLKGLKVLDLTNVIAGPTIGAMFSRLGAEVLKIDSPKPMYAPDISVIYGIATNIGKKSLLLDILSDHGRRILELLIKDYDILLINCTHECLKRLKLTKDDLYKINTNIILVHFDAWGGPNETGKYNNFIGYDDNIQAGIGIMSRFGGSLETCEEHAHVGTIDVIAGVACAAFAVYALYLREEYGKVNVVRTSLASVGQYVQYPLMFSERQTISKGITCRGDHVLYSCYETLEGWIFIGDSLNPQKTCFTYDILVKTFGEMTIEEAIQFCVKHGWNVSVLKTMDAIRKSCVVDKYEIDGPTFQFLIHYDHPAGVLTMVAPIATRITLDSISHSPKYGRDTYTILKKYGMENSLFNRAVSCSWSKFYIPYSSPCDSCKKKGRKLFTLTCDHKLCFYCMGKAENKCSTCGMPHETSIEKLDQILKQWKVGYKQWRRGLTQGSKDMETLFHN